MEETAARIVPNILSLAGVDPSGGAGLLADIKTISALGGYACGAVTALTVQNTRGVSGVRIMSGDFVSAQMESVLSDIRIDAVKIGMLGNCGGSGNPSGSPRETCRPGYHSGFYQRNTAS